MISVHVVVGIIGNILNIPRDVGSHNNIKYQVFRFLAEVKTILYLDSLQCLKLAKKLTGPDLFLNWTSSILNSPR